MIPSPAELIAGWSFIARRRGLTGTVNAAAVAAVVQVAVFAGRADCDAVKAWFTAWLRERQ